jgi:hypothetical protein
MTAGSGMPLIDYLLMPVQRILQLKVLFEVGWLLLTHVFPLSDINCFFSAIERIHSSRARGFAMHCCVRVFYSSNVRTNQNGKTGQRKFAGTCPNREVDYKYSTRCMCHMSTSSVHMSMLTSLSAAHSKC